MKKLTILIVLGLVCLFFKVYAQSPVNKIPLKVGDTIPDLIINNIVNFKSKSIHLNDYKDKLLILDFWATYCEPCIRHMPMIYALQKKYANNVFILPVDMVGQFDPPAKVIRFLKERKKAFDLPSAVSDTVLKKLFMPPSLGVYIYIKNGIVSGITDEELTEESLNKALKSETLAYRTPVQPINDYSKPIFQDGNGGSLPERFYSRSLLFPYTPNIIGSRLEEDSVGRISRAYFYNLSVLDLLITAEPVYGKFGERIKIDSKHPEYFSADIFSNESKRAQYLFCYESNFAPTTKSIARQYMKEDLARYFPFRLDSVTVKDTSWVLRLSARHKLKTGDTTIQGKTNIFDEIGLPIYYYNYPISSLRLDLEHILKIPVLDETGFKGNLWLDLPGDLRDSKEVVKSLERQGISMTREIRSVKYLIVKDRLESN